MATRFLFLSTAFVSLAACADEPPGTTQRQSGREYELQTPQPTPAHSDPLPQAVRDALQADAMKRSGLSAAQLSFVSSEKVTWNDGALGCPQPGRMYTQALVPGFRVWIRAGERMLIYHASESGELVLCPNAVRRLRPDAPIAQ